MLLEQAVVVQAGGVVPVRKSQQNVSNESERKVASCCSSHSLDYAACLHALLACMQVMAVSLLHCMISVSTTAELCYIEHQPMCGHASLQRVPLQTQHQRQPPVHVLAQNGSCLKKDLLVVVKHIESAVWTRSLFYLQTHDVLELCQEPGSVLDHNRQAGGLNKMVPHGCIAMAPSEL